MDTQNLIKQKLALPESVAVIRQILEAYDTLPRSGIAKRVCERLGLLNARGNPQQASCLKALKELESGGHFELPAARRCPKRGSPRRLGEAVEPPRDVPTQVGEVLGLELIRVETGGWDLVHQPCSSRTGTDGSAGMPRPARSTYIGSSASVAF